MPSTPRYSTASAASTLLLLTMSAMDAFAQSPIEKGCYSSSQPLTNQGSFKYQSSGHCQEVCDKINQPVMGLSDGNLCWCGDMLPAADSKTSSSNCDIGCDGYGTEMCGGTGFWTVYLTGTDTNVPTYQGGSSGGASSQSSSSSPTSSTSSPKTTLPTKPTKKKRPPKPTVVTSVAPGTTVVVTRGPESSSPSTSTTTPTPQSSGSSTNVAAIAGGVVVGVIAIAGIVAGVYFFLRHKRKREAEEEYKRTQVADFMAGKPPQTGYSGSGASDSRLDPEAGARRTSHGSLADNQDFSRRILRVANPDRS